MGSSRTSKSLKNTVVALCFFAVEFVITFYSRKVFLQFLGEEVLGLNTTAVNLLQFLNLAEMGISAAVNFSLYKPLRENDLQSVNEIVSLQGKLYKRVATSIIVGACILMCFFPLIFRKITLPLWYAYASFGVLLFSSLLGYYVNYRQIVLSASQQNYKIQYSVGSCKLIKIVLQIIFLSTMPDPYVWWLILEFVFAIISSCALNRVIKKEFPNISSVKAKYKELKPKYYEIIKKTKQAFFHSIGGFALSQSSPLIIYAYANLSLVALYGNYMIVSTGIQRLTSAIFNSVGAGIGDLIAEGNKENTLKVFYELFSLRFLLSAIVAFSFIALGQQLIAVWIGRQYLLSMTTLIIISLTLFIGLNRYTVLQFLSGRGQYQDIYSPIIEAALNIGLSILLGYYYGLNGILSGVLISLICVVEIWKPIFLFKFGLKESVVKYFLNYLKDLGGAFLIGYGVYFMFKNFWDIDSISWFRFIVFGISEILTYILILILYLYLTSTGFRNLSHRIKNMICRKIRLN